MQYNFSKARKVHEVEAHLSSGAAPGEQCDDGPRCVAMQMQAEFGASPQHILSSKRPFFFDEPVEFALAEAISETATEILGAARGTEDALDIAAIAVG
jgi:hypothetical protein